MSSKLCFNDFMNTYMQGLVFCVSQNLQDLLAVITSIGENLIGIKMNPIIVINKKLTEN